MTMMIMNRTEDSIMDTTREGECEAAASKIHVIITYYKLFILPFNFTRYLSMLECLVDAAVLPQF